MRTLAPAIAAVLVAAATPLAAQPRQPPAKTPNLSTAPPVIPIKVYIVEQVVTTNKLPPQFLEQMRPLKTLRQVEELLKANSVPYAWRKTDMNSAALPPAIAKQIEAVPPGEVFVIPSGETLTMNVILGRR